MGEISVAILCILKSDSLPGFVSHAIHGIIGSWDPFSRKGLVLRELGVRTSFGSSGQ